MSNSKRTPAQAYMAMIDAMAERSDHAWSSRVRAGTPVQPGIPESPTNRLVASLDADQRAHLADLLDEAKRSGMHDALVVLNELLDEGDLRLTYQGAPMPVDFSGMGLHGDFIGRADYEDRWAWPESPPGPATVE